MNDVRAVAFAIFLGLVAAPAVAENPAPLTLPLHDAAAVQPQT
jgi:hypothetical protein